MKSYQIAKTYCIFINKFPQCNKFPLSYSIINNLKFIIENEDKKGRDNGSQLENHTKAESFRYNESSSLLGNSDKLDKFEQRWSEYIDR